MSENNEIQFESDKNSFDSGIFSHENINYNENLINYNEILRKLNAEKKFRDELRKRLSQLTDRRAKKKKPEPCNVCFTELDVDDIKICVPCCSCEKSICRGKNCSYWLPKSARWECQLCNLSKASQCRTTEWINKQTLAENEIYHPMKARSELNIPIIDDRMSMTGSLNYLPGYSPAPSTYGMNLDREKIRNHVEDVLAEMLGGSLDNISVGPMSRNTQYLPLWESNSSNNLDNINPTNISHIKLKRLIERIIDETLRIPQLTDFSGVPQHLTSSDNLLQPHYERRHKNRNSNRKYNNKISKSNDDFGYDMIEGNNPQYFDPKRYQELLATAVLNKIVDTCATERRSVSESSIKCIDNNQNKIPITTELCTESSSSSSHDPRSDSSLTDPVQDINHNNLASHLYANVLNENFDLESAISESRASFRNIQSDNDSFEDYASVASGADSTWEENWLFKKRKLLTHPTAPIGMLVPAPKEDIKAMIGDKSADEISDFSENEESDETNANNNDSGPENYRMQNKVVIGGQNVVGLFDDLMEQTSFISQTSSVTDNVVPYIETKNDYVDYKYGLNVTENSNLDLNCTGITLKTEAVNTVIGVNIGKNDDEINEQKTENNDNAECMNLIKSEINPQATDTDPKEAESNENVDSNSNTDDLTMESRGNQRRRHSAIEFLAAIALGPVLTVFSPDIEEDVLKTITNKTDVVSILTDSEEVISDVPEEKYYDVESPSTHHGMPCPSPSIEATESGMCTPTTKQASSGYATPESGISTPILKHRLEDIESGKISPTKQVRFNEQPVVINNKRTSFQNGNISDSLIASAFVDHIIKTMEEKQLCSNDEPNGNYSNSEQRDDSQQDKIDGNNLSEIDSNPILLPSDVLLHISQLLSDIEIGPLKCELQTPVQPLPFDDDLNIFICPPPPSMDEIRIVLPQPAKELKEINEVKNKLESHISTEHSDDNYNKNETFQIEIAELPLNPATNVGGNYVELSEDSTANISSKNLEYVNNISEQTKKTKSIQELKTEVCIELETTQVTKPTLQSEKCETSPKQSLQEENLQTDSLEKPSKEKSPVDTIPTNLTTESESFQKTLDKISTEILQEGSISKCEKQPKKQSELESNLIKKTSERPSYENSQTHEISNRVLVEIQNSEELKDAKPIEEAKTDKSVITESTDINKTKVPTQPENTTQLKQNQLPDTTITQSISEIKSEQHSETKSNFVKDTSEKIPIEISRAVGCSDNTSIEVQSLVQAKEEKPIEESKADSSVVSESIKIKETEMLSQLEDTTQLTQNELSDTTTTQPVTEKKPQHSEPVTNSVKDTSDTISSIQSSQANACSDKMSVEVQNLVQTKQVKLIEDAKTDSSIVNECTAIKETQVPLQPENTTQLNQNELSDTKITQPASENKPQHSEPVTNSVKNTSETISIECSQTVGCSDNTSVEVQNLVQEKVEKPIEEAKTDSSAVVESPEIKEIEEPPQLANIAQLNQNEPPVTTIIQPVSENKPQHSEPVTNSVKDTSETISIEGSQAVDSSDNTSNEVQNLVKAKEEKPIEEAKTDSSVVSESTEIKETEMPSQLEDTTQLTLNELCDTTTTQPVTEKKPQHSEPVTNSVKDTSDTISSIQSSQANACSDKMSVEIQNLVQTKQVKLIEDAKTDSSIVNECTAIKETHVPLQPENTTQLNQNELSDIKITQPASENKPQHSEPVTNSVKNTSETISIEFSQTVGCSDNTSVEVQNLVQEKVEKPIEEAKTDSSTVVESTEIKEIEEPPQPASVAQLNQNDLPVTTITQPVSENKPQYSEPGTISVKDTSETISIERSQAVGCSDNTSVEVQNLVEVIEVKPIEEPKTDSSVVNDSTQIKETQLPPQPENTTQLNQNELSDKTTAQSVSENKPKHSEPVINSVKNTSETISIESSQAVGCSDNNSVEVQNLVEVKELKPIEEAKTDSSAINNSTVIKATEVPHQLESTAQLNQNNFDTKITQPASENKPQHSETVANSVKDTSKTSVEVQNLVQEKVEKPIEEAKTDNSVVNESIKIKETEVPPQLESTAQLNQNNSDTTITQPVSENKPQHSEPVTNSVKDTLETISIESSQAVGCSDNTSDEVQNLVEVKAVKHIEEAKTDSSMVNESTEIKATEVPPQLENIDQLNQNNSDTTIIQPVSENKPQHSEAVTNSVKDTSENISIESSQAVGCSDNNSVEVQNLVEVIEVKPIEEPKTDSSVVNDSTQIKETQLPPQPENTTQLNQNELSDTTTAQSVSENKPKHSEPVINSVKNTSETISIESSQAVGCSDNNSVEVQNLVEVIEVKPIEEPKTDSSVVNISTQTKEIEVPSQLENTTQMNQNELSDTTTAQSVSENKPQHSEPVINSVKNTSETISIESSQAVGCSDNNSVEVQNLVEVKEVKPIEEAKTDSSAINNSTVIKATEVPHRLESTAQLNQNNFDTKITQPASENKPQHSETVANSVKDTSKTASIENSQADGCSDNTSVEVQNLVQEKVEKPIEEAKTDSSVVSESTELKEIVEPPQPASVAQLNQKDLPVTTITQPVSENKPQYSEPGTISVKDTSETISIERSQAVGCSDNTSVEVQNLVEVIEVKPIEESKTDSSVVNDSTEIKETQLPPQLENTTQLNQNELSDTTTTQPVSENKPQHSETVANLVKDTSETISIERSQAVGCFDNTSVEVQNLVEVMEVKPIEEPKTDSSVVNDSTQIKETQLPPQPENTTQLNQNELSDTTTAQSVSENKPKHSEPVINSVKNTSETIPIESSQAVGCSDNTSNEAQNLVQAKEVKPIEEPKTDSSVNESTAINQNQLSDTKTTQPVSENKPQHSEMVEDSVKDTSETISIENSQADTRSDNMLVAVQNLAQVKVEKPIEEAETGSSVVSEPTEIKETEVPPQPENAAQLNHNELSDRKITKPVSENKPEHSEPVRNSEPVVISVKDTSETISIESSHAIGDSDDTSVEVQNLVEVKEVKPIEEAKTGSSVVSDCQLENTTQLNQNELSDTTITQPASKNNSQHSEMVENSVKDTSETIETSLAGEISDKKSVEIQNSEQVQHIELIGETNTNSLASESTAIKEPEVTVQSKNTTEFGQIELHNLTQNKATTEIKPQQQAQVESNLKAEILKKPLIESSHADTILESEKQPQKRSEVKAEIIETSETPSNERSEVDVTVKNKSNVIQNSGKENDTKPIENVKTDGSVTSNEIFEIKRLQPENTIQLDQIKLPNTSVPQSASEIKPKPHSEEELSSPRNVLEIISTERSPVDVALDSETQQQPKVKSKLTEEVSEKCLSKSSQDKKVSEKNAVEIKDSGQENNAKPIEEVKSASSVLNESTDSKETEVSVQIQIATELDEIEIRCSTKNEESEEIKPQREAQVEANLIKETSEKLSIENSQVDATSENETKLQPQSEVESNLIKKTLEKPSFENSIPNAASNNMLAEIQNSEEVKETKLIKEVKTSPVITKSVVIMEAEVSAKLENNMEFPKMEIVISRTKDGEENNETKLKQHPQEELDVMKTTLETCLIEDVQLNETLKVETPLLKPLNETNPVKEQKFDTTVETESPSTKENEFKSGPANTKELNQMVVGDATIQLMRDTKLQEQSQGEALLIGNESRKLDISTETEPIKTLKDTAIKELPELNTVYELDDDIINCQTFEIILPPPFEFQNTSEDGSSTNKLFISSQNEIVNESLKISSQNKETTLKYQLQSELKPQFEEASEKPSNENSQTVVIENSQKQTKNKPFGEAKADSSAFDETEEIKVRQVQAQPKHTALLNENEFPNTKITQSISEIALEHSETESNSIRDTSETISLESSQLDVSSINKEVEVQSLVQVKDEKTKEETKTDSSMVNESTEIKETEVALQLENTTQLNQNELSDTTITQPVSENKSQHSEPVKNSVKDTLERISIESSQAVGCSDNTSVEVQNLVEVKEVKPIQQAKTDRSMIYESTEVTATEVPLQLENTAQLNQNELSDIKITQPAFENKPQHSEPVANSVKDTSETISIESSQAVGCSDNTSVEVQNLVEVKEVKPIEEAKTETSVVNESTEIKETEVPSQLQNTTQLNKNELSDTTITQPVRENKPQHSEPVAKTVKDTSETISIESSQAVGCSDNTSVEVQNLVEVKEVKPIEEAKTDSSVVNESTEIKETEVPSQLENTTQLNKNELSDTTITQPVSENKPKHSEPLTNSVKDTLETISIESLQAVGCSDNTSVEVQNLVEVKEVKPIEEAKTDNSVVNESTKIKETEVPPQLESTSQLNQNNSDTTITQPVSENNSQHSEPVTNSVKDTLERISIESSQAVGCSDNTSDEVQNLVEVKAVKHIEEAKTDSSMVNESTEIKATEVPPQLENIDQLNQNNSDTTIIQPVSENKPQHSEAVTNSVKDTSENISIESSQAVGCSDNNSVEVQNLVEVKEVKPIEEAKTYSSAINDSTVIKATEVPHQLESTAQLNQNNSDTTITQPVSENKPQHSEPVANSVKDTSETISIESSQAVGGSDDTSVEVQNLVEVKEVKPIEEAKNDSSLVNESTEIKETEVPSQLQNIDQLNQNNSDTTIIQPVSENKPQHSEAVTNSVKDTSETISIESSQAVGCSDNTSVEVQNLVEVKEVKPIEEAKTDSSAINDSTVIKATEVLHQLESTAQLNQNNSDTIITRPVSENKPQHSEPVPNSVKDTSETISIESSQAVGCSDNTSVEVQNLVQVKEVKPIEEAKTDSSAINDSTVIKATEVPHQLESTAQLNQNNSDTTIIQPVSENKPQHSEAVTNSVKDTSETISIESSQAVGCSDNTSVEVQNLVEGKEVKPIEEAKTDSSAINDSTVIKATEVPHQLENTAQLNQNNSDTTITQSVSENKPHHSEPVANSVKDTSETISIESSQVVGCCDNTSVEVQNLVEVKEVKHIEEAKTDSSMVNESTEIKAKEVPPQLENTVQLNQNELSDIKITEPVSENKPQHSEPVANSVKDTSETISNESSQAVGCSDNTSVEVQNLVEVKAVKPSEEAKTDSSIVNESTEIKAKEVPPQLENTVELNESELSDTTTTQSVSENKPQHSEPVANSVKDTPETRLIESSQAVGCSDNTSVEVQNLVQVKEVKPIEEAKTDSSAINDSTVIKATEVPHQHESTAQLNQNNSDTTITQPVSENKPQHSEPVPNSVKDTSETISIESSQAVGCSDNTSVEVQNLVQVKEIKPIEEAKTDSSAINDSTVIKATEVPHQLESTAQLNQNNSDTTIIQPVSENKPQHSEAVTNSVKDTSETISIESSQAVGCSDNTSVEVQNLVEGKEVKPIEEAKTDSSAINDSTVIKATEVPHQLENTAQLNQNNSDTTITQPVSENKPHHSEPVANSVKDTSETISIESSQVVGCCDNTSVEVQNLVEVKEVKHIEEAKTDSSMVNESTEIKAKEVPPQLENTVQLNQNELSYIKITEPVSENKPQHSEPVPNSVKDTSETISIESSQAVGCSDNTSVEVQNLVQVKEIKPIEEAKTDSSAINDSTVIKATEVPHQLESTAQLNQNNSDTTIIQPVSENKPQHSEAVTNSVKDTSETISIESSQAVGCSDNTSVEVQNLVEGKEVKPIEEAKTDSSAINDSTVIKATEVPHQLENTAQLNQNNSDTTITQPVSENKPQHSEPVANSVKDTSETISIESSQVVGCCDNTSVEVQNLVEVKEVKHIEEAKTDSSMVNESTEIKAKEVPPQLENTVQLNQNELSYIKITEPVSENKPQHSEPVANSVKDTSETISNESSQAVGCSDNTSVEVQNLVEVKAVKPSEEAKTDSSIVNESTEIKAKEVPPQLENTVELNESELSDTTTTQSVSENKPQHSEPVANSVKDTPETRLIESSQAVGCSDNTSVEVQNLVQVKEVKPIEEAKTDSSMINESTEIKEIAVSSHSANIAQLNQNKLSDTTITQPVSENKPQHSEPVANSVKDTSETISIESSQAVGCCDNTSVEVQNLVEVKAVKPSEEAKTDSSIVNESTEIKAKEVPPQLENTVELNESELSDTTITQSVSENKPQHSEPLTNSGKDTSETISFESSQAVGSSDNTSVEVQNLVEVKEVKPIEEAKTDSSAINDSTVIKATEVPHQLESTAQLNQNNSDTTITQPVSENKPQHSEPVANSVKDTSETRLIESSQALGCSDNTSVEVQNLVEVKEVKPIEEPKPDSSAINDSTVIKETKVPPQLENTTQLNQNELLATTITQQIKDLFNIEEMREKQQLASETGDGSKTDFIIPPPFDFSNEINLEAAQLDIVQASKLNNPINLETTNNEILQKNLVQNELEDYQSINEKNMLEKYIENEETEQENIGEGSKNLKCDNIIDKETIPLNFEHKNNIIEDPPSLSQPGVKNIIIDVSLTQGPILNKQSSKENQMVTDFLNNKKPIDLPESLDNKINSQASSETTQPFQSTISIAREIKSHEEHISSSGEPSRVEILNILPKEEIPHENSLILTSAISNQTEKEINLTTGATKKKELFDVPDLQSEINVVSDNSSFPLDKINTPILKSIDSDENRSVLFEKISDSQPLNESNEQSKLLEELEDEKSVDLEKTLSLERTSSDSTITDESTHTILDANEEAQIAKENYNQHLTKVYVNGNSEQEVVLCDESSDIDNVVHESKQVTNNMEDSDRNLLDNKISTLTINISSNNLTTSDKITDSNNNINTNTVTKIDNSKILDDGTNIPNEQFNKPNPEKNTSLELTNINTIPKLIDTKKTEAFCGTLDMSDEDDQNVSLIPGSIAEREHKKWYNAVEMPNNPYAPEALLRRLDTGPQKPLDIPDKRVSTPITTPEEEKITEAELSAKNVDLSIYSRDYYVPSPTSNTTKSKLIKMQVIDRDSLEDKSLEENSFTSLSDEKTQTLSLQNNKHNINNTLNNKSDIFSAKLIQIVDSTDEEQCKNVNELRADSSPSDISLTNSLSLSEDSDTLRIYNLNKQETTLITKENQSKQQYGMIEELEQNNNMTRTPPNTPITPTTTPLPTPKTRPNELKLSSASSQSPCKTGKTAMALTPQTFKFLHPKRKIIEPSQIMTQEQYSTPPETPDKPVIEEDVVNSLPSVKALARAFLLTSGATTIPDDISTMSLTEPNNNEIKIECRKKSPLEESSSVPVQEPSVKQIYDGNQNNLKNLERPISPVLKPGKLKDNIAFFENLKKH
ncbi:extracellular matrix-binding protein ebh-like [Condylostylus longicornis]|uniref:extracellular matrix-binding protein ebh-like n=1 Tax=Condylostylus longicornis TaxID=2530218 RepID=UPI00244E3898|nr:extracellular matrix-binding protein ebh-like [Condylostylus longicornis]